MFVSFIRNQEQSPLLRLPSEVRNMVYRYVLDTAIIRILPNNRYLPRFLFRTPSSLLVARQIHGEASAFQDQYIAVRITLGTSCRRLYRIFTAIRLRASRFRAVQELEIPQRALDQNVRVRDSDVQMHPYYRRVTQQDLPALETVVWTPGRNLSQQVREETVRYTFDRSVLRIVDREADVANDGAGDDDEWTDDEGEPDEEDTKDKDDSGDYEDSSMEEDCP
jgi:hypothetical protein